MDTELSFFSRLRARVTGTVRRFFWLIVIVVLLVAMGGAFLFGRSTVYHAHPELAQTEAAEAILDKVGKLIILPVGEVPTMATIDNADAVRAQQPLLAGAQNGDVVILYSQAHQVILYRPSTNKLIVVGPVDTTTTQAPAPTPVIEDTEEEDNASSTDDHEADTEE